MRLLFLSTWFPFPPDNGSKQRVYHLLRALGRRHAVTLISFAFGTARPDETDVRSLGCEKLHVIRRSPFERSQLLHAIRFLSPVPIVELPVRAMARCVASALADGAFEAVVASTSLMAPYVPKTSGTAKILEEHNAGSRVALERCQRQQSNLARLQARISWQKQSRYEKRTYAAFDLCTMVSEQDRRSALEIVSGPGPDCQIVPNGVDCDRNRPGIYRRAPNTLIYNGALTYSANYDAMAYFLTAIYPRIQQQVPDVTLTITGSLEGVDLSGLPRDDSVRLSGYVDDVRPLVGGAAACVVPIREGGGTRLKILEAMALGTPVVATPKGAEGLNVTPDQHLLLEADPAGFAQAVIHLLGQPALQEQLAANARRLVETTYDWRAIGDQFTRLVEQVAQGRKSP